MSIQQLAKDALVHIIEGSDGKRWLDTATPMWVQELLERWGNVPDAFGLRVTSESLTLIGLSPDDAPFDELYHYIRTDTLHPALMKYLGSDVRRIAYFDNAVIMAMPSYHGLVDGIMRAQRLEIKEIYQTLLYRLRGLESANSVTTYFAA